MFWAKRFTARSEVSQQESKELQGMDTGYDQHTAAGLHLFTPGVAHAQAPNVATSPAAAAGQLNESTSRANLDVRLQSVLNGLVAGFGCDAADLYTLNPASNELLLRSHFQVGEGEPGASSRPLREARADVAAMSGSAIVLEDDIEVAEWPVPVWCGAALCLPVASDETIHGTLWLYSREPRRFTDAELGLAEIVAGRLAVELELTALRLADPNAAASSAPSSQCEATSAESTVPERKRPTARLVKPSTTPMLDDWELAGLIAEPARRSAFYDWQTLADGRTMVVAGTVCEGIGPSDSGWLQAARVALRAHLQDSHDAGDLLTRANHTLWTASPGGEGLALGVMLLDSDGVHASVALAGAAAALKWRAASHDWIAATCPPLGWNEQTIYVAQRMQLNVRERLVLLASDGSPQGRGPAASFQKHLCMPTSVELRSMPGKRALRHLHDAAESMRLTPASSALVRRR